MPNTLLKSALGLLEALLSIAAFFGGVQLIRDPSGQLLQLPAERFLAGSPFADYLIPGVVLLVVNGIFPMLVAVGAALRWPWTRYGHVAVGVTLTGWMLVQLTLIGYQFGLQGIVLGQGLLILVLATVNFVLEGRAESLRPAAV